MITSLNIVIRVKLPNRPGTLAGVLAVIAREGGSVGNIDLVSASPNLLTRDIMIRLRDSDTIDSLVKTLGEIPGVTVIHVADRVFTRHLGGKINIQPQKPVTDWEDLSIVYTPGVAGISEEIAHDPDMAYSLTIKGNSVAIVTDGSAVLGLGKLGPAAALPVMEGKSILFKKFADINAFPLCLNARDTQGIIDAVAAIAPSFGGINLEDIAAPQCFEIEERLTHILDIPVFHDDQHGTAIVALAGLLNALKVAGKDLKGVRVVINGAGAAGVSIAKILLRAGADNIVVCDRKGAISRNNLPVQPAKLWLARNTNKKCITGNLRKVMAGADVFIGVSGPSLITREDVLHMAHNPIVFALANPNPEIYPELIYDVAGVVATGRSDYPNQINNALAFPGVFRGALDCRARSINDDMCLAAAYALAGLIDSEHLAADNIIPSVFNDQVAPAVARAVVKAARKTGVAGNDLNIKING